MEKRQLLISRCMKLKSDGSEDMRQQEVFGLFLLEERERHGSLTWQIAAVGFSGVEIGSAVPRDESILGAADAQGEFCASH